jgi:hypothetical protein
MQMHHVVEYNLFEDIKAWAEVAVIGPLLLCGLVVVLPPVLALRCAGWAIRKVLP